MSNKKIARELMKVAKELIANGIDIKEINEELESKFGYYVDADIKGNKLVFEDLKTDYEEQTSVYDEVDYDDDANVANLTIIFSTNKVQLEVTYKDSNGWTLADKNHKVRIDENDTPSQIAEEIFNAIEMETEIDTEQ